MNTNKLYSSSLLVMKRFFLCCFFLSIISNVNGQCPPGSLTLSSQSEIDNFATNYPGCTTINGNLTISGPDIFNFLGLSQLESVNQAVVIDNCPELVDFQGLENLTYIEFNLWIKNNPNLKSLDGFGLQTLGFWLDITNNPVLENLHGLSSMTSFGEGIFDTGASLNIIDNASLIDLVGLEGIVEITSHVWITNNASLYSLKGLENVISLKSYLELSDNPALEDITALAGIDANTIFNIDFPGSSELRISDNTSLSYCAIQSVCDFLDIPDPDYDAIISNNLGDCIDQPAVEAACDGAVCEHPDYNALVALYNATDGANWIDNTGWVDGAAGTDCDPCSWYGVTCDGSDRVICLDLDGSTGCNSAGITAGNDMDGFLPAEINELTELEQLHLEGNGDLVGSLPAEFYELYSLKVFAANYTGFSGVITSDIANLTNLEEFTNGFNQIGGPIPAEFGDLTSLTNLNLFYAFFSGDIPASLGNLVNLTEIRLNDNQLTGCFPSELSSLCGIGITEFGNNPGLPGGGDFAAFCASGEGTCLNCFPSLAGPEIGDVTTEDYMAGGSDWTRYNLPVTNWAIYPPEMFVLDSQLPPCGANPNASRSWVSIYDNFDNYIYGFCALDDPMILEDIWFAMPQGECPPESIFVEIHDRACDDYFYSDLIDLTCFVDCEEENVMYFDTGWQGWVDGGSDCRRNPADAAFAYSGNRCLRLRDDSNSSIVTSPSLDLQSYTSMNISFTYITESMDNENEGFLIEYSTDGITYSVIGSYFLNSEFVNGEREFVTMSVEDSFSDQTTIRFRSLGNSNNDRVYIDDVFIYGCGFVGGCIVEDYHEFDTGWGIWNDGGSDCRRSPADAAFANSGNRCVRLRDDGPTSNMTTDNIDASGYTSCRISFTFITDGMDEGEGFTLESSLDGGITFSPGVSWFLNAGFDNNVREFPLIIFQFPFSSTTQFRFRSMGSSNADRVYIDDVEIEFCGDEENVSDENAIARSVDKPLSFEVYPNPLKISDDLTLDIQSDSDFVNIQIIDIYGRTVKAVKREAGDYGQVRIADVAFVPGTYIVSVDDGKNRTTKSLIVVD